MSAATRPAEASSLIAMTPWVMTSATFQLWFLTKGRAFRNASFSAVAALGADLAPAQEIAFTGDAYQHIAIVDDRKPAYPLAQRVSRYCRALQ